MKKILLTLLVLTVLSTTSVALAEDTGIQIIGGPESEGETVSLDDMLIGKTAHIEGFGDVTILSANIVDTIYTDIDYSSWDGSWEFHKPIESGSKAEFLEIRIDILNTQKQSVVYFEEFGDIICDYGDGYQFGGWARQERTVVVDGYSGTTYYQKESPCTLPFFNADDSFPIDMLYTGNYLIAVTLPNTVCESDEPLSVTFTIGDNEFTYYHRK